LLNLEDGAQVSRGRYDFDRLRRAFATVQGAPSVVQFCEAKNYRDHAGEAKYAAAEALSDELGGPYAVELGSMTRGPLPPAIFYDPNRLVLRRWWQHDDPGAFDDQRNVATFALRDSGETGEQRTEFLAWVHHFEPLSGDVRLEEAKRVSRYGDTQRLPVLGGGDLNATGSGKHLPQRDWMAAKFEMAGPTLSLGHRAPTLDQLGCLLVLELLKDHGAPYRPIHTFDGERKQKVALQAGPKDAGIQERREHSLIFSGRGALPSAARHGPPRLT